MEISMMLSTFFLFTVTLILSVDLLTAVECPNPEVAALTALKNSLSDPNNWLQSWDPELVDPCAYFHIACNGQSHVTRVDLGDANLSGKLVPELGNLSQLLVMFRNNIEGSIPPELGKLTSLIDLDLSENNLSGSLPSSLEYLKSSLQFLGLNDNKLLSGTVPPGLACKCSEPQHLEHRFNSDTVAGRPFVLKIVEEFHEEWEL